MPPSVCALRATAQAVAASASAAPGRTKLGADIRGGAALNRAGRAAIDGVGKIVRIVMCAALGAVEIIGQGGHRAVLRGSVHGVSPIGWGWLIGAEEKNISGLRNLINALRGEISLVRGNFVATGVGTDKLVL